jgi:hypothetical protein
MNATWIYPFIILGGALFPALGNRWLANAVAFEFPTLIEGANRRMEAGIDFAVLPGGNADDGEEDEFQMGTQPRPNENGHPRPPRRERAGVTQ